MTGPEYNKNRLMLLEEGKIKIFALVFGSPDWWPVSHRLDIFACLQESMQKYKLKKASCRMQPTRCETAITKPFYSWK